MMTTFDGPATLVGEVVGTPPRRHRSPFALVARIVSWLTVAVIAVPLVFVIVRLIASQGDENSIVATMRLPGLGATLRNSAIVIVVSAIVAVVVACALAWLNERTNARLGTLTEILPVLPMMVPSIAGAIGWVLLASPTAGFINVGLRTASQALGIEAPVLNIFSWPGLIFVYSIYMVPQVYLTVAAALRNVDPALEEAARVNGSSPFRTLVTVTLPAVRPAILSGALLAFVYGIALFSVPLIIGTQARIDILTVQVVRLLAFTFPPRLGEALMLSLLVAIVLAVLWWVNGRVARSGRFSVVGGRGARHGLVTMGPVARTLCRIFMLLYLFVVSVLPLLALIVVSFQGFWSGRIFAPMTLSNYQEVFAPGSDSVRSLLNSIGLGALCAVLAIAISILIWYTVSGRGASRSGRVIDGVTKIPATLSHMVVAVALLITLGGKPFNLSGTLLMLVIAYVVLYIPQASLATQSANQMIGRDLSEASWVSGAGPGATVAKIILPLARGGLVSGWAFVFVLVVGDITASALLASPGTPVVGFLIMSLFQNGSYPLLAALGAVISIASSIVVLTVLGVTNKRRKYER